MDFSNRGARPGQAQQQPAQSFENPVSQQTGRMPDNKRTRGMNFGKLGSVFLLVGTAILMLALIFALTLSDGKGKQEADLVASDKYQAVFLNSQDGQVYFGKLGVYNSDLYALTDIYYVRVENPIQPEGASETAQQQISLAKLGSELHGPEDVMYIARDKVLYWENLKDDGQVVKAITEYKKTGATTNTTTPATSTTPADSTTEDTTDTTTP